MKFELVPSKPDFWAALRFIILVHVVHFLLYLIDLNWYHFPGTLIIAAIIGMEFYVVLPYLFNKFDKIIEKQDKRSLKYWIKKKEEE